MRARRGLSAASDLCSGPGKLTQALGIELEHNGDRPGRRAGRDRAAAAGLGARRARRRHRGSGSRKAVELPWRFCARGLAHVSRPWPPGLLAVAAGRSTPAARRAAVAAGRRRRLASRRRCRRSAPAAGARSARGVRRRLGGAVVRRRRSSSGGGAVAVGAGRRVVGGAAGSARRGVPAPVGVGVVRRAVLAARFVRERRPAMNVVQDRGRDTCRRRPARPGTRSPSA